MSDPTATVVLVHGAWHGAWCWEPVVERLSARAVPVVAVDLPGHGRDPGPLTDLNGDAERVREVLDELDPPVVLVGHSYGGAVITQAGVHPSVSHLVYLCALALDRHETCVSAAAAESSDRPVSHEDRPDLASALMPDEHGLVTLDASVAAACLYNDCDSDAADWAVARLGPQPLVTLQQAPRAVAWREKPSTYVVCTHDLAIHPDLQRILAKRCTNVAEWDTGHSPFLSQPDRLADFIRELAGSAPLHGPQAAPTSNSYPAD